MEVMSEHTDNELKKITRWSSWYLKQELIAGIEELVEDMVSQKGMKRELAEVKRDVGKKIKPLLKWSLHWKQDKEEPVVLKKAW